MVSLIVGPLASWIGSWVMYAIGEAAENSVQNNQEIKKMQDQINALKDSLKAQAQATDQPMNEEKKLYSNLPNL